jgi:hypothetical protein
MDLAAMYGTPGGPSEEDKEKVAQADLFVKLAAEQGIDLNQFSDEQIEELWNATFSKEASENGEKPPKKEEKEEKEDDEDDEEKKAAAAQAEFEATQEWQEKVAEMDYLGRLMAHAYVNELGEIGEAMEKEAKMPEALARGLAKARGGGEAALKAAKGGAGAVGSHLERLGRKATYGGLKAKAKAKGRVLTTADVLKGTPGGRKAKAIGAGIYGAGAAGAAGAGEAARRSLKKESSAIDEYAAELALQKVAEINYDVDEAAERIGALYTLGAMPESEKIASAGDVNEAVEIRALEMLEAAGYPVDWQQEQQ